MSGHVLAAAARFYTPIILLFAGVLLLTRPPVAGIGFVAGLACILALVLHLLVFGAAASRQAAPPIAMRLVMALGALLAVAGVSAPGLVVAPHLVEAGAFVATTSGGSLVLAALIGRAPTLRDETL